MSALYYADRINQLPIGVIGIAVGTVLLPEMSRRMPPATTQARARAEPRHRIHTTADNSLSRRIPVIPDLIMRALFLRGEFTAADAVAAAHTLTAYALGLIPFVLIRTTIAPFFARGDTATPVKASLTAVAINIALQGTADGSARASRACDRDLDWRLDQSHPGLWFATAPDILA